MVCNASVGGVALEGGDVAFWRWRKLSVFLYHSIGGQPRDGVPSSVLVLEYCLEFSKEVVPGS